MKEKTDKGTLAIKIIASIMVVAALIGVVLFMYFNKPKPHENFGVEHAGKYELSSISGQIDDKGNIVTVNSYDYNYINLMDDGTFEIANKINGRATSVKGVWYVEGNTLYFEISKMLGLVKHTDKGVISNGTITMSLDAQDTHVVMILKRK